MATDVRPIFRKAFVSYFKANPTHPFYTGVNGQFAYMSAPTTFVLPYAVFFFIGANPDDTWTESIDELSIQLSVWGKSSAEAETLASAATDLFGKAVLAPTETAPIYLYRSGTVPTMDESDSGVALWQSGIELGCSVQTL